MEEYRRVGYPEGPVVRALSGGGELQKGYVQQWLNAQTQALGCETTHHLCDFSIT